MSQYKVSLHDCNKDPDNFNDSSFKFRTVFWRNKKAVSIAVSIGKLVRKRITTKIVLEVFKFWDSFPETKIEIPAWKDYLKRTLIKEYEPV